METNNLEKPASNRYTQLLKSLSAESGIAHYCLNTSIYFLPKFPVHLSFIHPFFSMVILIYRVLISEKNWSIPILILSLFHCLQLTFTSGNPFLLTHQIFHNQVSAYQKRPAKIGRKRKAQPANILLNICPAPELTRCSNVARCLYKPYPLTLNY
jgi:hypothetical protein